MGNYNFPIIFSQSINTTAVIDYIYYDDTTTITLLQLHYYDGFRHVNTIIHKV